MKGILLALILLISNNVVTLAAAEIESLNKELVSSFIEVSQQFAGLQEKYPELANYSTGIGAENRERIVEFLKASPAYPEISEIIESSQIADINQLFEISERILGIAYLDKLNGPFGVTLYETRIILKANLNALQANKASEAIIEQAVRTLNNVEARVKIAEQTVEKVTDQDKTFMEQNRQWLIQKGVLE